MSQPAAVRISLVDEMQFQAETPSGFSLRLDAPTDDSVEGAGMRPMEVQLVALGGCGAMDVISILRKMRQDVTAYDVSLTYERATEHPRVYTKVLMTHTLRGRVINPANVRRAIGLSMERYCPVYAMLSPGVEIRERYSIIDEAEGGLSEGEVSLEDGKAPSSA